MTQSTALLCDACAEGDVLTELPCLVHQQRGAAVARPPTKAPATAAPKPDHSGTAVASEKGGRFENDTLPEPPVALLPAPVAAWVEDVAERLSVPLALTATMALGVLASTTTGKVTVRIDPTWDEPVCLYVVCAMPPASRKSRILQMAAAPVMDYMHDQVAAWKAAPPEYRPDDPRVILAGDATQEGLGIRLAQTGGRCTIIDAEGDWLDIMAGRYSSNPSMGVALKGWSAEPFDVTRAGRPDIHLPSITLSAALAVQPQVLQDLASKPQALERGLIPRLLICQPPRMRSRRTAPVSDATLEGWARLTRSMAATLWNLPTAYEVRMDDGARALIADYHERVEDRIEGDMLHLASWAGKSVGTAARLAALFHVTDHIASGWQSMVTAEYVMMATEWMDYYAAWALRCYPEAPSVARTAARNLEPWVERQYGEWSRRQAWKANRRHFPEGAESAQVGLDYLLDEGTIEVVGQSAAGAVARDGVKFQKYRTVR